MVETKRHRILGAVWRTGLGIPILGLTIVASAYGAAASPKDTAAANGLWVVNALTGLVSSPTSDGSSVEFQDKTLKKPGVSIATPNGTNSSGDFHGPQATIFDATMNQWVSNVFGSNANHGSIVQFKLATLRDLSITPAPSADVIISDDGAGSMINPAGMAFENNNLWVANLNGPFVTEYLSSQITTSGSPTPNITLTDTAEFRRPHSVQFDSAGDLFVADFDAGKVWVFRASSVASFVPGTNNKLADANLSDPSILNPVAIALDPGGNLWVTDCGAPQGSGKLYMFPKTGLTTTTTAATNIFTSTQIITPNGTDTTLNCPSGIVFDKNGNLWYTNAHSTAPPLFGNSGQVAEFKKSQLSTPGISSPTPRIFLEGDTGLTVLDETTGLAFGPAL